MWLRSGWWCQWLAVRPLSAEETSRPRSNFFSPPSISHTLCKNRVIQQPSAPSKGLIWVVAALDPIPSENCEIPLISQSVQTKVLTGARVISGRNHESGGVPIIDSRQDLSGCASLAMIDIGEQPASSTVFICLVWMIHHNRPVVPSPIPAFAAGIIELLYQSEIFA